jgi:hypothetical protein
MPISAAIRALPATSRLFADRGPLMLDRPQTDFDHVPLDMVALPSASKR